VVAGTSSAHPQASSHKRVLLTSVPGNHDITLDKDFLAEHGDHFHNQNPQSHEDCLSLLADSPSITYLDHSSAIIRLETGPRTTFSIFGSPYSPRHGLWAFGYDRHTTPAATDELTKPWDVIPLSTDIVVTHTPPRMHCDEQRDIGSAGCEALRQALWRVRPRLAVCGHIHPSRGARRVSWDLRAGHAPYCETAVEDWQDPSPEGSQKLSLVDLSSRTANPLRNDGSHCTNSPRSLPGTADARCGRLGRQETCIVNASIMKSNYPHKGGKKMNKPIVVDIDLPTWET
jgi:Calcineurin-like phosphoesterase